MARLCFQWVYLAVRGLNSVEAGMQRWGDGGAIVWVNCGVTCC